MSYQAPDSPPERGKMHKLRAFRRVYLVPSADALPADDILEFHAARLLMLLHLCGRKNEINGLTKLAKLDFFVRYPEFFIRACRVLGKDAGQVPEVNESPMVRHHYGPWDHRYYQVLGFLEATGLIVVAKSGSSAFRFTLTEEGVKKASALAAHESYRDQRIYMELVRKRLGQRTGSNLKDLIYRVFDKEIAAQPLGTEIR